MKKRISQSIRPFVLGVLVTILTLGISMQAFAAATGTSLTAYFNGIKIYVDQQLVTPTDATGKTVEPFIVNGTTYLPVRAVAAAVGKSVTWDSATSSVYIGQAPVGQMMSDILKPYYSNLIYLTNQAMTMAGTSYSKGYEVTAGIIEGKFSYSLEGKYTSISGVMGLADSANRSDATLAVYGDDTLITTYTIKAGELPSKFNINVTDRKSVV